MASRQFYYAESLGESTTTSTTYGDKVSLTFTPDANSDYLFIWSAKETNSSNITSDYKVRLFDDTGSTTLAELNIEGKDVSPTAGDYQSVAGIALMSFGASPSSQTVSLEFAAETATNTIRISNATITAIKLHADDKYAAADSDTSTTSSTYVDKTTLTFTPATQGDYLILSSCEWLDDGTGNGGNYHLLDPSSAAFGLIERFPQDVTIHYPWNTMVKQNLTASSKTYKTQFRSISGTATVFNRRSRIFALRLDNLPDHSYGESRTRATTTSTTYQDKVTLTDTPAAQDQLRIAVGISDGNVTNNSSFISFDQSGSLYEVIYEPSISGGVNGTTSCTFTSSKYTGSGASTTWKTQYRSEGVALTTGFAESAIAVLQLTEPETAYTINWPTQLAPTGKVTKHFYDGWQAEPMPADVVPVDDRAIHHIVTEVPLGLFREPHQGYQQASVVPDNDVSFSATWLNPNPEGRERDLPRDLQIMPPLDDNYESFSRAWDMPNPLGLYREPHQGIQLPPERPDFFEQDQETLERRVFLVPDGLDRTPRYDGFQAQPLADDNEESSARLHTDIPPYGLDQHSTLDFQAGPLSDDNYESFTRTWTEVPPGANPTRSPWEGFQLGLAGTEQDFIIPFEGQVPVGLNPLRTPWEGAQAAPLAADVVPDVPLLGLTYPHTLWPRYARQPHFIFDGFFQAPLSDDAAPGVVGTVWRPTFMPRRR